MFLLSIILFLKNVDFFFSKYSLKSLCFRRSRIGFSVLQSGGIILPISHQEAESYNDTAVKTPL